LTKNLSGLTELAQLHEVQDSIPSIHQATVANPIPL